MTRNDLAARFSGHGVELGVAAGHFSAVILSNPHVRLLASVDRWSDHHDEDEYRRARERLSVFKLRSIVMRYDFAEAVRLFADGSLDFAYLDAYAHEGQCGGRLLEDWWPKVKSGGIFAGHDYHPEYQPTVDVVDAFVAKHGLQLNLTTEAKYPSWWVIKP
jgi:predicted O-methyltransferase YrrM